MPFFEVYDEKQKRNVKIYYELIKNSEELQINSNNKTILLIHGWLCNSHFWDEFKDYAKKGYALIIPDLRGHGKSDYAKDVKIETLAEDINKLLEYLNINKCIVFGHSMGGLVAQTFYHKHPQKVIALGLFNTGARLPFGYGIKTSFYVLRLILFILMLILSFPITSLFKFILAQGWKLSFYKKGKSVEYKKLIPHVKNMNKKSVLKAAFSLPKFNLIDKLSEIEVPTLILHGANDKYVTIIQLSNKMASLIPNNRFEIIPNSAHFSINENLNYIKNILNDFLHNLV